MLLRRTGLEALGVETCSGAGMTTGLTALATTHRVVHRVHDDTAVVRTAAEPAAASSLAARFESMNGVTYHTDSGAAGEEHLAGFTGSAI